MKNIVYWLALLAAIHIVTVWVTAVWRGTRARHRHLLKKFHTPRTWPFVSVIIPAWQERGTLEFCITSLRQVDYPRWEVIVVAGGPDGTYQAAVEACMGLEHIRVIEQLPRGKNAALNAGLRTASGEIIVLLDADSRVSPEWLRALVTPINEVVLATTGTPIPLRQTPIALNEQMERIGSWGVDAATILQGSGSIAIHRTVIEEMGGFPEDVLVGVDWDLNARLAAHGVARAVCPQAMVYTERAATLREYWRNEVRWRRAHLNSLFRLSEYFLRDLTSIVMHLYIYALSWFSVLFTCLVSIIVITGRDEARAIVLVLWIIFVAWILLRRASLAGNVAAFTGDLRWLKLVWVPPLLLCVTLVAIIPATLTLKQNRAHFKGPRMNRYRNHAS